jgi:hypothetical protein
MADYYILETAKGNRSLHMSTGFACCSISVCLRNLLREQIETGCLLFAHSTLSFYNIIKQALLQNSSIVPDTYTHAGYRHAAASFSFFFVEKGHQRPLRSSSIIYFKKMSWKKSSAILLFDISF